MLTFRVAFVGCKVNQYEAEALREGLQRLGLGVSGDDEVTDLFVLNTCSVTGQAGATSRKLVRRAVRENPAVDVLVTGCYAESDRAVLEALPGVVAVFGNGDKDRIVPFVARRSLGAEVPDTEPLRITRTEQTRAFVKIEDGCDDACSFCIIPLLRGPARSRAPETILAEVRDLVAAGHREVVLTGVHLGYFGKETGNPRAALHELLVGLIHIPGLARLKLSSIEVHEITDTLLDLMAAWPVFVPHFHIPLQSGSDRILRLMRRKYRSSRFLDRIDAIRSRWDRPALSTDVIVGFPGEAERDFRDTLAVCEQAGFMKVHVFPYSARGGTAAPDLPDPVPDSTREERKQRLLAWDAERGVAWRRMFVGEPLEVLVESRRDAATGLLTGLTGRYVRVLFDGPDRLMGQLVDVRGEQEDGPALRGTRLALETVP